MQGSMVQRPPISLGILGWIVEAESSSEDVIAFIENSLGQSQIMQTRSDSSSFNSLKDSSIMTSTRVGRVALTWWIDIPRVPHFLFFPLEAWKSSSWMGSYPKPNLPLLSESSIRAGLPHPMALRPWPNLYLNMSISFAAIKMLRASRTRSLKHCGSWKLIWSYGGCFWKGISIDVGNRCLLEDSRGLFSHNVIN